MATFQRNEHVVIRFRSTDPEVNNALTSASVSTKITIKDPDGNTVIDGVAMTEDSDGVFRYNYLTSDDADNGDYVAEIETINTTDNLRTISKWTFTVEDL